MENNSLHVYGDSILKGVIFDEIRNRYVILRDNCITALSKLLPVPTVNNARMGQTAPEAERALSPEDLAPGGLALIEFGGNDCDMPWEAISRDPDRDHQAKTPLPSFLQALERLVNRVRTAGMTAMLVIPPPLDAERYFGWISRNLNPAAILRFLGDVQRIYRWQELYANAVADTAQKLACPLINLREPFLECPRFRDLLCVDGIHPSAQGHALMQKTLEDSLTRDVAQIPICAGC